MKSVFINRILEVAAINPNKVAIVDNGGKRQTTYAELMLLAHKFVSYLHAKVEEPQAFIAVKMPYCMEFIAAEIGIWLCKYAAVPLGMSYPQKRIEFIMKHCESPLMLTTDLLDEVQDMTPMEGQIPEVNDNAMLLYTSGSTGNPKGVLITYKLLDNNVPRKLAPDMSMEDVVFGISAPLYFAFSNCLWDVIQAGGTVHLYNDEIKSNVSMMEDYILQHDITASQISPAALLLFHNKSPKLKVVITSGEKLSTQYSKDGYILYNLWGQTETGLSVIGYRMPEHPMNVIPIGKCRKGLEFKVVDGDDNIVQQGETGELCLRGPLFKEYYKAPELTTEAYRNGWLHTKDLVRVDENGDIIYVQRNDWMVKVNGQRVEPGEVEVAMLKIEGVTQAVVKGFDNGEGSQYLCGYFTTDSNVDGVTIRKELSSNLPSYMVPAYYVKMESFPLNANGKLDRKSLTAPDSSSFQAEYVAPTNELEKALCDVFASVLKLDKVSIIDDFALLGGDSIRAMKIQQMFNEEYANRNWGVLSSSIINLGHTPKKIAELLANTVDYVFEEMEDYPLNTSQRNYVVMSIAKPNLPVGLLSNSYKLDDSIDMKKLATALEQVTSAHKAFGIRIIEKEPGKYRQKYVSNPVQIKPEKMNEEELAQTMKDLYIPFAVLNNPLFRIRLIEAQSGKYLLMSIHHAIIDGTSISVLMRDISLAYDDKPIPTEEWSQLEVAQVEQQFKQSNKNDIANKWFKEKLQDITKCRPAEDVNGETPQVAKKLYELEITPTQLQTAAQKVSATLNVYTTTVFARLMAKYSGQNKVAIWLPYASRDDYRTQNTVGQLANGFILNTSCDEHCSLKEQLENTNQYFATAMAYIYADKPITPINNMTSFLFQGEKRNSKIGGKLIENLTIEKQALLVPAPILIHMHLDYTTSDQGVVTALVFYHSNLYSEKLIKRMIDDFSDMLKEF